MRESFSFEADLEFAQRAPDGPDADIEAQRIAQLGQRSVRLLLVEQFDLLVMRGEFPAPDPFGLARRDFA